MAERTHYSCAHAIWRGLPLPPLPHYLLPVFHGCLLSFPRTIPAVSGDIPALYVGCLKGQTGCRLGLASMMAAVVLFEFVFFLWSSDIISNIIL